MVARIVVTYLALCQAAEKRGHRIILKSSHDGQEYPAMETADLMVSVMGKSGGLGHTTWEQAGTRLDMACSALLVALRERRLVA